MDWDRLGDWCVFGPFLLTERSGRKWVRALALLSWWPWVVVASPLLCVYLCVVIWEEL